MPGTALRARFPDLWTQPSFPAGPVKIDYAHPLARGLVGYWPAPAAGINLAAKGSDLTPDGGATFAHGARGPGFRATANGQRWAAPLASAMQMTDTVTVWWLGTILGTPGTNAVICGAVPNNINASPFTSYTIARPSATTLRFFGNTNNTFRDSAATTVTVADGETLSAAFAFIASTGTIQRWKNGLSAGSDGTVTSGSISYASTALMLIGTQSLTLNANTYTALVAVWDRVLAADEQRWIHDEPCAVLRPSV